MAEGDNLNPRGLRGRKLLLIATTGHRCSRSALLEVHAFSLLMPLILLLGLTGSLLMARRNHSSTILCLLLTPQAPRPGSPLSHLSRARRRRRRRRCRRRSSRPPRGASTAWLPATPGNVGQFADVHMWRLMESQRPQLVVVSSICVDMECTKPGSNAVCCGDNGSGHRTHEPQAGATLAQLKALQCFTCLFSLPMPWMLERQAVGGK